MRSHPVQFDRAKFQEAVWLLVDYCPHQELGNVKLHKMLYFADMIAYIKNGCPITGVEYLKQKFGPTARHLSSAMDSLRLNGLISVEEDVYYGFFKKKYVSLKSYSASHLSDGEQFLLRDVADFVRGKSAKQISELSHNLAWEAAELGEPLPYFSALQLLPDEITDEDTAWANVTAKEYATSRPW